MKEKTLLIVDDMSFDREVLSRALSRKLGCKIVEASSGTMAIELVGGNHFDAVLLDVEMPEMSGEVVLAKIREIKGPDELPIIMVSGKSQDALVANCLRVGANDFVHKPINFEIVLSRILNHLKLGELIRDRARFHELAALNAIVTTYNHEINNPLTIANGFLAKLESDRNNDIALKKVQDALDRIADTVRKIKDVTEKGEAIYETYVGTSKMLKIK